MTIGLCTTKYIETSFLVCKRVMEEMVSPKVNYSDYIDGYRYDYPGRPILGLSFPPLSPKVVHHKENIK